MGFLQTRRAARQTAGTYTTRRNQHPTEQAEARSVIWTQQPSDRVSSNSLTASWIDQPHSSPHFTQPRVPQATRTCTASPLDQDACGAPARVRPLMRADGGLERVQQGSGAKVASPRSVFHRERFGTIERHKESKIEALVNELSRPQIEREFTSGDQFDLALRQHCENETVAHVDTELVA